MGLTRKDNDMVQVSITVNGKVRTAHVEPRLLLTASSAATARRA